MSDCMSREEAIQLLEDMKKGLFLWDMTELIDLCISALSENKGDLISRQAVENITWEEPNYSDPLNVLTEVREKVRALPSVENKGEWIATENEEMEVDGYFCSKCHLPMPTDEKTPFCPFCGADMRDPKDIIHKAIDNTTFAEEAYPNIKEELHKAVDMAESEDIDPNDMTHMFDGVTAEMCKDAFKGWTLEEMLKQTRAKMRGDKAE